MVVRRSGKEPRYWSYDPRIQWYKISTQLFRDILGLYSLSRETSYHKISWSLEVARFGFKLFQSLWNLAGTSAALLPRCLSNFRAIRPLQYPISRLRDFARFGGKTSYRLVNRGPGFSTRRAKSVECTEVKYGINNVANLHENLRNLINELTKLLFVIAQLTSHIVPQTAKQPFTYLPRLYAIWVVLMVSACTLFECFNFEN